MIYSVVSSCLYTMAPSLYHGIVLCPPILRAQGLGFNLDEVQEVVTSYKGSSF